MKKILAVAVVLVVVLTGLVAWKIRSQNAVLAGPATGSGVVEGTAVDVASTVSARVLRVQVQRGDRVRAGQALLSLDCTEPRAALAEAEARVEAASAQAQAAADQAEAAARATGVVRAQIAVTHAQASALDTQQAAAARDLARLERLGSAIAPASVDRTRAESAALADQHLAATNTGHAQMAQTRVALAQAEAARAQADAAVHQLAAARSAIVRAQQAVADCELTAPRDGLVDDVYYEVGELAPRGMPLLRIVDLSTVKAIFYLPNAEISAARTGATATVEADAYPGARWRGTITSVSAEAAFTPRNVQTRTDRDRLVYPIEVRVANADERLRPGMPVTITLPRVGHAR